MKKIFTLFTLLCLSLLNAQAHIWVPQIFSNHMVLQRHHKNPVWGTSNAGEKITITIDGRRVQTTANATGQWRVTLPKMPAGGPHTLMIQGKSDTLTFDDVLIGEVWICSDQGNKDWTVANANNAALTLAAANNPQIRLFKPAQTTSTTPLADIDGSWTTCNTKTAKDFTAIGYYFGRRLQEVLQVPVGLIDISWTGSNVETWLAREALEDKGNFKELLSDWDDAVDGFTDQTLADYTEKYNAWKALPRSKRRGKMSAPRDIRIGANRPANGYNGMIHPIIGYGIQGVIWNQGLANIGRSYQHRRLFPKLITSWRTTWSQGDFPVYWTQLTNNSMPVKAPEESYWAEFRESQTMALKLPHTGQVVTHDLDAANLQQYGDKQTIANRLVHHALTNEYGYEMACQSPRYESMQINGNTITITFSHVDQGLMMHAARTLQGFEIAGQDKKFVFAKAKIVGTNKVEVYADGITKPVAVRYAWSSNPTVNLYDKNGLPVTSFRTDNWPGRSFGKEKARRRSGS